jgi:hypothetical protein
MLKRRVLACLFQATTCHGNPFDALIEGRIRECVSRLIQGSVRDQWIIASTWPGTGLVMRTFPKSC